MRVEMTGRAWRQRSLGAALACVLVAAGCTGGGPADRVASSAPSDSATPAQPSESNPSHAADSHPEPRSSAPTLPAAAEGDSVRAAEAFVRHYIELLNYAMTTGDTKAFRAASAKGCSGCNDYLEFIRDVYDKGGFYNTDGWKNLDIRPGSRGDAVIFTVSATAAPVNYQMSKTAERQHSREQRFDFAVGVKGVRQEWKASGIYVS